MQIKIVRGLAVAMALGLSACSGSSSTSTSSAGSTGATGTPTTTGTHSTSTGGTNSTSTSTTTNSTSTGGTTATNSTSTGTNGTSATTATTANSTVTGSTSTGTHGSTSTGSTGTTSANGGGSTGSTDTDCGSPGVVCADGTYCHNYGTQLGIGNFYACGCDQADSTTHAPDTCRDANNIPGGNGLVVCDDSGSCRAPRDYEDIFEYGTVDTACAPGFTVLHFVIARPDGGVSGEELPDGGIADDYPDGGINFGCLELCDSHDLTNHACSATFTSCVPGALSGGLPDGGEGSIDACIENDCGEIEYINPDGGANYFVDAGSFYGGCTTDHGAGSGFCTPLPNSDGTYGGVCFVTGTATINTPCTGLFGEVNSTKNCTANEMCLGSGFPDLTFTYQGQQESIASAYCLQTCNAADTTFTCAPINSKAATCFAFSGDPSETENPDYQYGYCSTN